MNYKIQMSNLLAVETKMLIAIIIISLILLSLCIYITYKIVKNIEAKRTKIVNETSLRLKGIKQLNNKFNFDNSISKEDIYYEQLKSKSQFDNFNFNKAALEKIILHKYYYKTVFIKLDNNNDLFKKYVLDYEKLPAYASAENISNLNISYNSYQKIEHKLCDEKTLKPLTEMSLIFNISYTSPAGRNNYTKSKTWNYRELKDLYNQMLANEEFKKTKEYQRKLLSPSLRYDVLKRDNFKCVICGRTEKDGIKLHVDHIKPVAKGGKTELANLRTLCDECNIGKSSKYDKSGVN